MPSTITIGGRTVHALNDGEFRPQPQFFEAPDALATLSGTGGAFVTPIGAFLWPGEDNVLVDAGVGPVDYRGLGMLVGGNLLDELAISGYHPEDVDILALSHLHPDHAGWLASAQGQPTFTNATVVVAAEEWRHFVMDHPDQLDEHLAHALATLYEQGRVELIDGEWDIAPGLRLLPAPGHTPGHSVFALHDQGQRVLLLGDAVLCPLQLTESDFETISDVDRSLARRTRDTLSRALEEHGTRGVGCHFPGLVAGRLIGTEWVED